MDRLLLYVKSSCLPSRDIKIPFFNDHYCGKFDPTIILLQDPKNENHYWPPSPEARFPQLDTMANLNSGHQGLCLNSPLLSNCLI